VLSATVDLRLARDLLGNATSHADRRGDVRPSAMQHSGAADGPASSAVSQVTPAASRRAAVAAPLTRLPVLVLSSDRVDADAAVAGCSFRTNAPRAGHAPSACSNDLCRSEKPASHAAPACGRTNGSQRLPRRRSARPHRAAGRANAIVATGVPGGAQFRSPAL
jgi:hypothetical protein